jgi:hypothetical protein
MSNKKDESSGEDDEPDQNRNHQKKRNTPWVKESVEKEFVIKSNTLDEGTMAFIHWLNSTHKKSTIENPIVVKSFENDKCTVLLDRDKQTEVHVDTKDGVPICQYCKADDCAHVGFTICLEQLHGRGQTLDSIEAEAEIEDTIVGAKKKKTSRTWGYYLCICFIASQVFFFS